HIWLSPPLVKIQAKHILSGLISIDPVHREIYERNYSQFIARVESMDQELKSLFLKTSSRRQRIRYLSVTFTDLISPPSQLSLFEYSPHYHKESALASALDHIRTRYGNQAVQVGRTLYA
ncbi:zinc ABC transporter substrate-binding protein, partial [bacterium]|nr:zinc ABC transporter substrate-binding protein [bacterium]